jgi:Na+:H+ antiporter, NhaA family
LNLEKTRDHVSNDDRSFKRRDRTLLPKERIDWLTRPISRFLHIEAAAGSVLLVSTLAALALANSFWAHSFNELWETPLGFYAGPFEFTRPLREWINDALMTLFFFLVALELKRELVLGELRDPRSAALSVAAALGGMLAPALIYLIFQFGQTGQNGWGTVMATDTAFVIGCLALLGARIPRSLRVFMLSLAIVDDIGAILVVAIGYGSSIDWLAIALAFAGLAVIKIMAALGIRNMGLYFPIGVLIWFAVDASGIHPTVTGVVLGLMTPTGKWVSVKRLQDIMNRVVAYPSGANWSGSTGARQLLKTAEAAAREALSPVERLEIMLHPWVGYVIMPLFALANAGVPLAVADFGSSVTVAVFIGFTLGKPVGILVCSWFAVRTGIAVLTPGLRWELLLAGGMLAGIGFTMALFIANLAFSPELINAAKLGILSASAFSALAGTGLLIVFSAREKSRRRSRSAESGDRSP